MKSNILLFILMFFLKLCLNGQQLDIKDTFEYIESIESIYREDWSNSIINYKISEEGVLIQEEYYKSDINKLKRSISVHVDDLIKKVGIENDNYIILKCKSNNCFTYKIRSREEDLEMKTSYINHDGRSGYGIRFLARQEYQQKKMINAINYLFSLIENQNYLRDTDDPFVGNVTYSNTNNKIGKINKVYFNEDNGAYYINVKFGDINKPFVLDSGATEMSISSVLEKELLSKGIITSKDYLSDGLYKIADGRIVSQRRVMLRNMSVGDFKVKNISASIGDESSPLLLGKNFLDMFKYWSINNSEKILELKY